MITGRVERGNVVILEIEEQVILKAYASADGKNIRIVLPELENFAQTRIRDDHHCIDFIRDAREAKRLVETRGKR